MDRSVRAFTQPDFRPAVFVRTQRARTDLEHLGAELTAVLDAFKAELVEVIHQDYDAFLRLSGELQGTDRTVHALRAHLGEREVELKELRAAVSSKVHAVEELAKQQAVLRERRRALVLLMELSTGLQRCEAHLADDARALAAGEPLTQPPSDERGRHARALERVADQLHRLATVAELEGLPEVGADALERLATARVVTSARASECTLWAVRARNGHVLAHCLRAVEALDAGAELVELVRERIVRPRASALIADLGGLSSVSACLAALLGFVTDELGAITGVGAARQAGGSGGGLAGALAPLRLVANAIWPEIVAQLVAGRPGLFATGVPASFHANYTAAMHFGDSVEALCADGAELAQLRAHTASGELLRRWNLPLYFQLRHNEVVEAFEAALAAPAPMQLASVDWAAGRAVPAGAASGPLQLHLRASVAVARGLLAATAADVVLRPLAHRFLRLALQLPARYCTWAAATLAAAATAAAATPAEPEAAAAQGESAAAAGSAPAAGAPVVDVLALGAALYADAAALAAWLPEGYAALLVSALCLDEPAAAAHAVAARGCLGEAAEGLRALVPAARGALCADLERRCAGGLSLVRGIAAAYRFQAKGLPALPSAFMAEALGPVAAFAREHALGMPAEERRAVLDESLVLVAQRYAQLVSELAQTTLRTESSMKRLQPRRHAGAAAEGGVETGAPSDSDKIFAQLRLDAASFRAQVAALLPEERWPRALADALQLVDLATVQTADA
ncbi:oligomeric golgi complex component, COG2-domain-containing protein [Pavlovales sp. CCMP2436]|nr:oligomeric golgi complex component, COG2-domain-containing protein [Pavlovales sp. CCMP2436]